MPPIRSDRSSTRRANRIDPLARPDNSVNFQCLACMEDLNGTPVHIHGNTLCEPCVVDGIVKQFRDALKDETQYPVRFAAQEVNILTLSRFFTKQFLADWAVKVREYTTPVKDRLYCGGACGKFLGLKSRHRSTKICSDCGSRTCADCFRAMADDNHVCKVETDRFEGLQRGRDYQKCWNCTAPIELNDGCNHITCSCRAEWCFVCGEPAMEGSGHWDYGKPCPKWNHPDSNPQYDDRPADQEMRTYIQQSLATAEADGFAAANDPRELRLRNQDRHALVQIAQDARANMLVAVLDPTIGHPVEFSRVALAAAALTGSVDAYTLLLEPDIDRRWERLNTIDIAHPTIARWMEQVGLSR